MFFVQLSKFVLENCQPHLWVPTGGNTNPKYITTNLLT